MIEKTEKNKKIKNDLAVRFFLVFLLYIIEKKNFDKYKK